MQLHNNNIIIRTGSLKCGTKQIEFDIYSHISVEIFGHRWIKSLFKFKSVRLKSHD